MKTKSFNFNLDRSPTPVVEYMIPNISKIDIRFAKLLLSNLKEAKEEDKVLYFRITRAFVAYLYYETDIKINEQTLKRHLADLITDGYIAECPAVKCSYANGKYYYNNVQGFVATDKLRNALKKENLIDAGKQCNKCGQWKLYKYFHANKRSSDGYRKECKECRK